jgi:hypothetical protein
MDAEDLRDVISAHLKCVAGTEGSLLAERQSRMKIKEGASRGGYLYLTTKLSECWHLAHSNVRLS